MQRPEMLNELRYNRNVSSVLVRLTAAVAS